MSQRIRRDHSLTVRLSSEERAQVEALAEQMGNKDSGKSAAIRHMMFSQSTTLPAKGYFTPLGSDVQVPLRLMRRVSDD